MLRDVNGDTAFNHRLDCALSSTLMKGISNIILLFNEDMKSLSSDIDGSVLNR